MASKITPEIQRMFKQFKSMVGAPIRKVQMTDDQLCDILSVAQEDYASYVQNWLIKNQWANLYGKNVSNTDMAYALSVRSLEISSNVVSGLSSKASKV